MWSCRTLICWPVVQFQTCTVWSSPPVTAAATRGDRHRPDTMSGAFQNMHHVPGGPVPHSRSLVVTTVMTRVPSGVTATALTPPVWACRTWTG